VENPDGRVCRPKPLQVGVQISRGIYPEVSSPDAVWAIAAPLGRGVSKTGRAKGEPDRRGASDARSCAYADFDSAEVRGVARGGYIKGKSAIYLGRMYGERKGNFGRQHFWARGYFVSTVGRNEAIIREYIRNQEQEDQCLEQLNLWR